MYTYFNLRLSRRNRKIVTSPRIIFLAFVALLLFVNENLSPFRNSEEAEKLDKLNVKLAQLSQERKRLEERVASLSGPQIDLDLLEERARIVLRLVAPNEVLLLSNKVASDQQDHNSKDYKSNRQAGQIASNGL